MKQVEINIIDKQYIEDAKLRLNTGYDIEFDDFSDVEYVENVIKKVVNEFQKYSDDKNFVKWTMSQRIHELKRICLKK